MGKNFRKIVSLVLTILMVASMAMVGGSAATAPVVSDEAIQVGDMLYFQFPEEWAEYDGQKVSCHIWDSVTGENYSGTNLWGSKKERCKFDEELGLWGFEVKFEGNWDMVIFYINDGPQTHDLAFTRANCTPDDYAYLTGEMIMNSVDNEKFNWEAKWLSAADDADTDSEVVVETPVEPVDTDTEVVETPVTPVDTDSEVIADSDTDTEVADTDSADDVETPADPVESSDTPAETVDTPKVYSLAGAFNGWSETDETTELVLDPATGLYSVSLELEPGSYEYKVVVNHSWDECYGDAEGANLLVSVSDTGIVTFEFDPATSTTTANGEFVYVITEHVYRAAGASDLFGSGWDPADDNNKLELNEETGLYEKTYDYEAEAGEVIEFKVTRDGATWYGVDGGNDNVVIEFPWTGEYTVTIKFDSETNTPSVDFDYHNVIDPSESDTDDTTETSDTITITTDTDITITTDTDIVVGSYISGDVDGNGKITSVDALMIQRYIARLDKFTDGQLLAADILGNYANGGKIGARDALEILRHIAGYSAAPEAVNPVGTVIEIVESTDTDITITTDTDIVISTDIDDTDSEPVDTSDVPSDTDTENTDSEPVDTNDVPSDTDDNTDSDTTDTDSSDTDVPGDTDSEPVDTNDTPVDTTDTPDDPANVYSIAGAFNGWAAEDETYELVYNPETGLYEITFTLATGSYEFKVVVNHSWDESYGALDGSNMLISVSADGDVTVTFNAETKEIAFSGEYVYEITEHTYRAAGSSDLLGSGWDPSDDNNILVYNEATGLYEKTYEYEAEADEVIEFKVTMDGAKWFGVDGGNDNVAIVFPADGVYNVTITFNAETNVPGYVLVLATDDTDSEIVDTDSEETPDVPVDTNDTPDTADTPDVPVDTDSDVETPDVPVDTDSDVETPDVPVDTDSDVETPDVPVDTDSDVETPDVPVDTDSDVETSDTPDEPVDSDTDSDDVETADTPDTAIYSVAGAFNGWSETDVATEMVYNAETGLYEFTTELAAGSYEFKVVVNHAWDESYGNADGSNVLVSVSDAGDVTITFDPNTKEIKTDGEFIYEITEHTYRVAGSADLCGTGWNASDDNNLMTLNEETGLYEITYAGYSADADEVLMFKVTMDGAKWFGVSADDVTLAGDSDVAIAFDTEGTYDITITFDTEKNLPAFTVTPVAE